MTGVRCPTCASGYTTPLRHWDICKNISFFRRLDHGKSDQNHNSLLFAKLLSISTSGQLQEDDCLRARDSGFQMLWVRNYPNVFPQLTCMGSIRVDGENKWPLKSEEFHILENSWLLPFECLQPAPQNQTLEVAHCRIRKTGGNPHFRKSRQLWCQLR